MTSPCDRLDALLATSPEAATALNVLEGALATHAAQCARCQAALGRSEALVRQLAHLHADFKPAPDLLQKVEGRRPHRQTASSSTRLLWAALGGAAVASLVAYGVARKDDPPPSAAHGESAENTAPSAKPGPTQIEPFRLRVTHCATGSDPAETSCERPTHLTTQVGERVTLRLSDGTRVTLDQQSELTLGEQRALRLVRGEARFDVVKRDDLPPLMVALPNGQVQVLGTELQVRAGESLSVVEVLRGLVSVDDTRIRAGEAAWLVPGRAPVVRVVPPVVDTGERVSADLGFGTLRARRPGGKADAERPLRLTDHQVTTRLQGAFSRTTIEEAFASDEPHELEGIYRFTLPPGAQVAELSLLVDGRWEEGAFVERERAERIWAGVIRNATPVAKRREVIEYIWVPGPWKDPALLSWSQGNTFELRIFPIPARGERRVRIAYTETLPLVSGARRYTLPLPADGSNIRAERFSLDLAIGGDVPRQDIRIKNYELTQVAESLRFTQKLQNFKPIGDLVVEVPEPESAGDLSAIGWGRRDGARRDGYLALGLRPSLAELHTDDGALDLVVIVDTSYGIQRARLERAAELVTHLMAALGADDTVQVLSCATTCRPLGGFEAASAERGRDLAERITRLEPLGSTRLTEAFKTANDFLERRGASRNHRRILYVGDGIQSVGELDGAKAAETARRAAPHTRVTAISLGGETDPVALGGLAANPGGSVLDATLIGSVRATAELAARRQRGLPLTDTTLTLPAGLEAVAPATLGDVWPGDERFVTARIQNASAVDGEVVLRGTMGGERVERRWRVTASLEDRAGHAFVPRLWAERRIADLSLRDDDEARKEVVHLSETHHVLSRHTSLLVLESPAMAKAFGVAPTRPVAHWDGEGDVDLGATELLEAAGGLAKKADLNDTAAHFDEVAAGRGGLANGPTETRAQGDIPMRPPTTVPADAQRRRGGTWVPMRKVWYKEAAILEGSRRSDTWAERQLERRERSLDESPDSRERTLAVIRTLVRLRDIDRATRLTERWLERDRMDPDALLTLADLALLSGDLDRAEALVASAIEADPRAPALHARLARLYAESNRPELACEHTLSRALTARTDAQAQAAALRCAGLGERVRAGLDPSFLRKIERLIDAPSARITGPFVLDATWDGDADIDLAVIDPDGRVMSWLGAGELLAEHTLGTDRERLVFRGRQNGRWQVLMVRRSGDAERLSGTLRITAHGATRRIPFSLGAEEPIKFLADIDVQARFRHEPL